MVDALLPVRLVNLLMLMAYVTGVPLMKLLLTDNANVEKVLEDQVQDAS